MQSHRTVHFRVLQSRSLGGKIIGAADRLQLGLGVACDREKGILYAADPAAGVRKLNLQPVGELLFDNKTSGEVELSSPECMCLSADGKHLAVSDSAKHHVVLLDAASLTHVRTFGRKGKAKGQLRSPDGVAIHDGSVYVADTNNHRTHAARLQPARARHSLRSPLALPRSPPPPTRSLPSYLPCLFPLSSCDDVAGISVFWLDGGDEQVGRPPPSPF